MIPALNDVSTPSKRHIEIPQEGEIGRRPIKKLKNSSSQAVIEVANPSFVKIKFTKDDSTVSFTGEVDEGGQFFRTGVLKFEGRKIRVNCQHTVVIKAENDKSVLTEDTILFPKSLSLAENNKSLGEYLFAVADLYKRRGVQSPIREFTDGKMLFSKYSRFKEYSGKVDAQNRFHGYGTLEYTNGKIISANWQHGEPIGEAKVDFHSSHKQYVKYVGTLNAKHQFNGEGVLTRKDGKVILTYEATWKENLPQGVLTCSLEEGVYQGTVDENLNFHGAGTFTKVNGDKSTGEWKNGKPTNQISIEFSKHPIFVSYQGLIIYETNIINFMGCIPIGEGILKCNDGRTIRTLWDGFEKNGNATITFPKAYDLGFKNYVGGIDEEGKFHGKGILKIKDYTVKGSWQHGVPLGNLILDHKKYRYKGKLNKEYEFHGTGSLRLKDSTLIRGTWDKGMPEEPVTVFLKCHPVYREFLGKINLITYRELKIDDIKGTFTTLTERKITGVKDCTSANSDVSIKFPFLSLNEEEYRGEINENALMHGRGVLTFHDSTEVTGIWKKDRIKGIATKTYSSIPQKSYKYEGRLNNKYQFHGKGTYTNAKGDTIAGVWANGIPTNLMTYTYNNGLFLSYEGLLNWNFCKPNGQGTITAKDGRKITANWDGFIPKGAVTIEFPDEDSVYVGEVSWDEKYNYTPSGQGTFTKKTLVEKGP